MDTLTVIEYKYNEKITPEQLSQVFLASKLIRPTDDYPRLQKMINHADILFTAWNGDQLVGAARAVMDFSYCCYLSDLAVDISYQKEGIGKTLLQLLKERIGEEVALILLAAPDAMSYYPHVGFENIDNGFRIARKK